MRLCPTLMLALIGLATATTAAEFNTLSDEERLQRYELLFNGKNLQGWDGDASLWSVQNGVIVGSTDGHPLQDNSFLVSLEEYDDFILRFEVNLRNSNSGMQFRSKRFDNWVVRGYQLDLAEGKGWGNLHGEGLAGGLILDGWQGKSENIVKVGWNQVELYCLGHRIRISINGLVVNDALDPGALKGVFALQLHRGDGMRVEYRNIRIRKLKME